MNIRILILGFVFALSACNGSSDKTDTTNTDSVANMKLATDSNVISAAIDSSHNAKTPSTGKEPIRGFCLVQIAQVLLPRSCCMQTVRI